MSWNIDNAHTRATFSVRHMMISNVHGQFGKISGTIEFDPQHAEDSQVEVQIDAASIDTGEPDRDNHLRSADFLNVEQYPQILFRSTRIETLDEESGKLYGELTIRDVTREVALNVQYNGMSKSPWGMTVAGFTANTKINRKDWGLTWNVALETGGVLVGDTINVNLEVEIIQQAEEQSVSA